MGGEKTTVVQQPSPPSVQETSDQAVRSQIEQLPDILAAQGEFGPQFTQQELDLFTQFGPLFAEQATALQEQFGPRVGAALRAQQEATAPELGAARTTLTEFLEQEELLTPQEERQLLQDVRQAQNVRGFALESGLGAQDELARLTDLRQRLKERRLNIALSTAGRAPIAGGSQVAQPGVSPGQLVQNVNPQSIFSLAGQNFGTQGGLFNVSQGLVGAERISRRNFAGDIIGGLIGAGGNIGAAKAGGVPPGI